MDELKNYLKQHEVELQVEVPDERRIWERIEWHSQKKTLSKRVIILTMRFAAAACIILLIGLGVWQFIKEDKKQVKQKEVVKNRIPVIKDSVANPEQPVVATQVKIKRKPALKPQPVEEQQIGDGYTQLIDYQLKRLRSTPVYAESLEYFSGFKGQLKQMDRDEALLRKDIRIYGFNDQLLEQLINIYQQKLNLLKSLQNEINKMNNKVKEKGSPGELRIYYLNI